MGMDMILFSSDLIQKQAVREVIITNDYTHRYGLALTEAQALELVETRGAALRENGRIELGGGVIGRIIREFCDSPYLSQKTYAETLHELTEIFYAYKNETLDLLTDEELILHMKAYFDGSCQGSLDLLKNRELYRLARSLRYGSPGDDGAYGGEEEYNGE